MDKNHQKAQVALVVAVLTTGFATVAIAETADPTLERQPEGTIFKSVDSDGTVVFTDQPGTNPNTVVVNPSPINISDPGPSTDTANNTNTDDSPGNPAAAVGTEETDTTVAEQKPTIDVVSIVSPLPDATLIDVPDPFYVGFETSPASLAEAGLTAEIYVDGRLAVSGNNSLLPITAPERGSHTLVVKLIDENGKTQAASKTQTVHIKKRVVAKGN